MTEAELREALAHPLLRSTIERMVENQVAAKMKDVRMELAQLIDSLRSKPRIVPEGYLTYVQAGAKYGYSLQSIRTHIHNKLIKGKGGLVEEASIIAYRSRLYERQNQRADAYREHRAR